MASALSFGSRLLIALLRAYQRILSPLLGSHCRFYPSCSQYAIESLNRFGVIKGCWLIMKRVLKCHPLNPGGNDPVPPKLKTDNNREH